MTSESPSDKPLSYCEVAFDLPVAQNFTYAVEGMCLVPGKRVQAPFGRGYKTGVVVAAPVTPPQGIEIKTLKKILDQETLFGRWSLDLAQWMSRQYLCRLGQALALMLPSAQRKREVPFPEVVTIAAHQLTLNPEQLKARQAILASDRPFYLWGLTGTGKTEVFLQSATTILDAGQQVLYLVPEIALTWPLVKILRQRFGSQVAILHSALTPAQRLGEWRKIQTEQAKLVVGARSAVFAPFQNLGLIIIDEEHETSYKSGQTPRYHARQVAFYLAQKAGAKLVMGSATPSLESYHALLNETFAHARLTQRAAGGAPPRVLIVPRDSKSLFSAPLIEAIHQTAVEGRQSILFLNRRGYGSSFHCRTCGEDLLCRHCSVSLTWHKARGVLVCHLCGYQTAPVSLCPHCGSLDVGWSVPGTEHVMDDLSRLFPHLKSARVDSDTAGEDTPKLLEEFGQGKLDILVGTQMVAKGLDFPRVKLVGILNAEAGLSLPDFRASERVYALIRQVTGRAGRTHPDGLVILQSSRPDNTVIRWAAEGQDEEFWKQELSLRQLLDFPPYSRLIRFVARSFQDALAQKTAESLAQELGPNSWFQAEGGEILGPSECAIAKQSAQYRYQVLLRAHNFPLLHTAAKNALERIRLSRDVHLEVDIDPLQLL